MSICLLFLKFGIVNDDVFSSATCSRWAYFSMTEVANFMSVVREGRDSAACLRRESLTGRCRSAGRVGIGLVACGFLLKSKNVLCWHFDCELGGQMRI